MAKALSTGADVFPHRNGNKGVGDESVVERSATERNMGDPMHNLLNSKHSAAI